MSTSFSKFVYALAVVVIAASALSAQTRSSATIAGHVADVSGAAIQDAEISVTNEATGLQRTVTSGANGSYSVAGLPLTGKYTITVSRTGFATAERKGLDLIADQTAVVDLVLKVAQTESVVNVYGTAEGVQADSPQLQTEFDLPKIDETPVLGRKISTLPLLNSAARPARGTGDLFLNNTLFVINGGGRRQTTYAIDNTTADDSWGRQALFTDVPFVSVEEFSVLPNSFSAEYGRTTGSAVSIVTKSGTNNFHGEFLGEWRPGSIEARTPLAITRTADKLAQGSGAVGGPIFKDRTYFFISDEYTAQNRDAVITSALAPGIFTGDFNQHLLLGRIDHKLTGNNTLTARLNFDRFSDTNPADAVGGNTLPAAARTFSRRTYAASLSEQAVLSSHLLNEARAQFQLGSPITQFVPVTPSTQFVYPGLATVGDSRSAFLQNHQYEFGDTLSWTVGRHSLKFGADVIYASSGGFGQEFGGGFVLGQFQVKPGITRPVSQLTINDVSRFTQSFGNQSYNVKEALTGLFVQDNFNLTRALTVNLGARYENQTFTDDSNNIVPRLGFAYRLPFQRPTVLRGSYGIFTSEIHSNLAAGFKINGPTGIFSFSAAPGQFGFPTSLAPLPAFPPGAVLPPRDITVNVGQRAFLSQFFDVSKLRFYPDALLNPYTQQWTFGFEHEIAKGLVFSVDYLGQHSIKLERPVDLNAPAPFIRTAPGQVRSAAAADATRPIVPVPNGFRRIVAVVNQGSATYDGLQLDLRKQFSHHFSGLVSYTWSHAINTVEPDVPQQDPNDNNFLGAAEKATSLLDQRHRLSLSGWYQFPWRITVGTWLTAAAGRPFNVTTGVDNNGDGSNSDRPVINGAVVPRNFGQGTPTYDLSMFVEKGIKLGERVTTSVRGEAFNLTNHTNIVGRNGVFGNLPTGAPAAGFGAPLGGINNVDPAREFQFELRLAF